MLESPPSPADTTDPAPGRGGFAHALTWLREWPYTFAAALSLGVAIVAYVTANHLGRSIMDPDGFLGPSYIRLPLIGLAFLASGVVPIAFARAYRATLAERPDGGPGKYFVAAFWCCTRVVPDAIAIVREQWSWKRTAYIATGLISFYTCYVCYRNLKSFLPLITDRSYDSQLDQIDAFLFFGTRPSLFLHDVLGTGIAAHILSIWYVSYLMLVPLSLGALLCWSRDLRRGAWYATALSLNWILGVVSYYSLPTLGPGIAYPSYIWELDDTGASSLQHSLSMARNRFVSELDDPTAMQGVAGFASLHVSVVVSACLIFQRSGMSKWLRNAAWIYLVGVVFSTLYFGWHYISDDVGGAFIGWIAVVIGAKVTGQPGWRERRQARARAGPAPPPGDDAALE